MQTEQIDAQFSHVLRGIVFELGGLAHEGQSTAELDMIIDNMLSKGLPHQPSMAVIRWIHQRRKRPEFKIAQILGAQVDKSSSIIPECLGKYYDKDAIECGVCLDRTLCQMKTRARAAGQEVKVEQQRYKVGKQPDIITIQQILGQKWPQISKALSRGEGVALQLSGEDLLLLSTGADQNKSEDNNMAPKKGAVNTAPPAAVDEELEEGVDLNDLDLELAGGDEGEEEQLEEQGAPVAQTAPKATPAAAQAAKPAAATPPAAEKAPKPKKAPPVLNQAQTKFQAELDKRTGEEKQKYSAEIAKKLKLDVPVKNDARIDHMQRCMAIKKKLGTVADKPAA